jgi:hypothetical protein
MPPLRLINTAHSQLGAFSISYPACWEADCNPWEPECYLFANKGRHERSWSFVHISALARQRLSPGGRAQVFARLAWTIGFAPDRCGFRQISLAGMSATELWGPSLAGYASAIIGWGEDGSVLLFSLLAPTRFAFNRVEPTWRRMARTVSWDQAKFHDYSVLARSQADGEWQKLAKERLGIMAPGLTDTFYEIRE